MEYVQQHAWADNTLKAISSEWKTFKVFCKLANITKLPVEAYVVCFFAIWLIQTGRVKTRGSLAQYVSAVRTVHGYLQLADIPTPSQYGPLNRILQGTRRLASHKTKKSLPVTPPILGNLLRSSIPPHFAHIYHQTLQVYKTLSLFYYLTMLRSSNLIIKSTKSIDLKMVLCWENVTPLSNDITKGILVTVPKSKNNQFGERDHQIPLAAASNSLLCPVKAILALVKIYGKKHCCGPTPVFQIPTGNGSFTPVMRHKFDRWFKTRLGSMNLDPSLYTLHAYRHGGIQECLLAEQNFALCKLSSDHSSDAILQYAFIPPERRLHISQKVNKSLADAMARGHTRNDCPIDREPSASTREPRRVSFNI